MSTIITENLHLVGIIADHDEMLEIKDHLTSIRRCYEEQQAVAQQINNLVCGNVCYDYEIRDSVMELKLELQKKWRETILSAVRPLARLDALCVKHGMDSFLKYLDVHGTYQVQDILNLCAVIAQV